MRVLLTIAALGAVIATGVIAAAAGLSLASSAFVMAAERPSFEVRSFPTSTAQTAALTPRRQIVADAR